MQYRAQQLVLLVGIISCCVSACSLILEPRYYRLVDASDSSSSDRSATTDSQMALDTSLVDRPPTEGGDDVHVLDEDVVNQPDATLTDSEMTEVTDTPPSFEGGADATIDVLTDSSTADVRLDAVSETGAFGDARMRYEFRVIRGADVTIGEPQHLQIRDSMGGGWLRITCVNTGTVNMQPLVPGDPNEFHRCDTDAIYRRFVFHYPSGLHGPNTTTIDVGCRARMGFEARIYDLRTGVPVRIATERDGNLIQECPDPYGVHVLLDSAVRDL